MKQILNEIAAIKQNLFSLQDMLEKIDLHKCQCEQDVAMKRQNAELLYIQTVEQLQNKKNQIEADYVQIRTTCEQKRKDAEMNAQVQYGSREKQIRSKCNAIIQSDKRIIVWLENAIAEMPPKMVKKIVAGPTIAPAATAKKELEDLYNKIFDGSFRACVNRTFHMDGYLPKAKMIQDFLRKAIAYKLYLESEIQYTTARCSAEIHDAYQRTQSQRQIDIEQIAQQEKNAGELRTRNLQALHNQAISAQNAKITTLDSIEQIKQRYEKELIAQKNNFIVKFNSFIQSPLVTQFTNRVRKQLVGTGAADADWIAYDAKAKYPQYSIGDFLLPIKITESKLISALQTQIPNAFRAGFFRIPLLLNSNESARFFVNYQQYDKNAICEFVQGVILQRLRCAEAGNIEVYFSEPDKSGQILGPFSARIQDNEEAGIYNINSKDTLKATLKKFAYDIDEINGLLGNYQSIYEYNQNCQPHIKERCMVLCDVAGVMDKEDWELLKVIWNNSFRCGVTIIIVSAYSINNISSLYPHMNVDVSYLNSKDIYLINCINKKCSIKHEQNEFGFILSKVTDARKKFVDLYRKATKDSQEVECRFAAYFDAKKEYPYQDSTKKLVLPIMLRNYPGGGQFEFVVDSETRAHTLLTGGTGSGKTTFLDMLISSIIMNYHPDDVELWLIDYGRSSFKEYVNKRPKHIRFISLENTETFTYSFLEYVDAYFRNRARLFKNANVKIIDEYRDLHGKLSMPRVVLIVDEFHNMTQHAKESPVHNKMLENILREYRKFGLSCIFSDQTCNTGLTADGAKQIANRLAMKQNNISDIIDTIDVSKSNYTAEQLHKMERTERGEIWCKAFYGAGQNDFNIEQFKVIYAQKSEIQTVLNTALKRNDVIYCDTQVHIVDGEQRKPLRMNEVRSAISSVKNADLAFCMGVPTSIEPIFCFGIEQRYGNNILVAGQNAEIGIDVIVELLLSAAMGGNNRILIFVDPRERQMNAIISLAEKYNLFSRIEVCSDYGVMCAKIKKYSNQIKKREQLANPTLILWLSMLDIYDELSAYGEYAGKNNVHGESFEVSAEKTLTAVGDEELKTMAEEIGVSVDEMLKMLSQAPEETDANQEPKPENGCIYNAIADINALLSAGSRYSLYSIVTLENASDMKRLKDFKLSNFILPESAG